MVGGLAELAFIRDKDEARFFLYTSFRLEEVENSGWVPKVGNDAITSVNRDADKAALLQDFCSFVNDIGVDIAVDGDGFHVHPRKME